LSAAFFLLFDGGLQAETQTQFLPGLFFARWPVAALNRFILDPLLNG